MAAFISDSKNVKFYLSELITSSIIHNTNYYDYYKKYKFGERNTGIVYIPENLTTVRNYKYDKTEIFIKNIDTILDLDLENINYKRLFDEFLAYINKNFKIAVTTKLIYSQGKNYETRSFIYNLYFSEISLEEKDNINLFSNLYLFLNKVGINKNIYNFKFLEEDEYISFSTDDEFNEFIAENLEEINLLTTQTGNVIDQINKNAKFNDIINNFINVLRDLPEFMGLNEYMNNIYAPYYEEITNEQDEKIKKLFIRLHIEAEKYIENYLI